VNLFEIEVATARHLLREFIAGRQEGRMTRVLLYALHVTYSPDYAFPLKAADASK
jgi:hypothetical protein